VTASKKNNDEIVRVTMSRMATINNNYANVAQNTQKKTNKQCKNTPKKNKKAQWTKKELGSLYTNKRFFFFFFSLLHYMAVALNVKINLK
jgi:lysozyme family protein